MKLCQQHPESHGSTWGVVMSTATMAGRLHPRRTTIREPALSVASWGRTSNWSWGNREPSLLTMDHSHMHLCPVVMWQQKEPQCKSISLSLSLCLSLSPSSYVTIPCAHLACPYHYLLHRYWKSVQIPHLASEWTERCPFCSTPLNHDKPAIKLLFN